MEQSARRHPRGIGRRHDHGRSWPRGNVLAVHFFSTHRPGTFPPARVLGARARLDCPGLLHHSAASELTAFGNCGSSALRIACRRPDRQLQRNAPLGLYADRARRHGKCFRHPRDARTVEPATGSAEVVHALTSPRCRRRARDCSWRGSSVREEEREHPPPQRVAVRLRDARHGTQRVDSRLSQESLRRECIHRIHDRIFRRHGV